MGSAVLPRRQVTVQENLDRAAALLYRNTKMKVRLATVWFGGCSGCHMSFLDLDEFLIDLVDLVEIGYSPVVDV